MTASNDDDHPQGPSAPAAGLEERSDAVAWVDPSSETRAGAHAQPVEVTDVAPMRPAADRRRYFLSSLEPSGEFDAVIVAVTDGTRRRYFTTRDGARLDEVGHDWFDHRSEDAARSLLELDERELGELEAELQFVRPVRGRDPIAEVEGAAEAKAEAEAEPETETEGGAEAEAEADDEATDAAASGSHEAHAGTEEVDPVAEEFDPVTEEFDPVTEEFEAMVRESRRSTFVQAEAAASHPPAPAPSQAADPEPPAAPAPARVDSTAPAAEPPPAPAAMTENDAVEQVALAKGIAFIAHRGQFDRSGAPYIDHPGRIAERFDPATEPVEAAAAWLHDVLEDTPITPEELFEAGVLPEVIEVVRLLTRTPDVAADEYYARIRGHAAARRVKLADIDDNTARWRLRRLDYEVQLRLIEKYRVARRALGSH